MSAGLQVPQLHPQRPKPSILKRPAVVGAMALLIGAAAGGIFMNSRGESEAAIPAASMVGMGRNGLPEGYDVVEEEKEEETKEEKKAEAKPVEPRSRKVLWEQERRFANPNDAIVERQVAAWAGTSEETASDAAGSGAVVAGLFGGDPLAEPELAGCVLKDGAEISAMQRGGVLQIMEPVAGYDYQRNRDCRAIRPGATFNLERVQSNEGEEEEDHVCAVRLNQVGGGMRNLGCWEVYGTNGDRNERTRVYYIRVTGDMSLGEG